MIDTNKLLANIDTNSLVGKMLGGMATKNFAAGLLTGGLGSTLLRKDGVENLAKMGGLAVLGTLAYKAYGNYQQQKASTGNASVTGAVTQSAQGLLAQAGGLLSTLSGQMGTPATVNPTAAPVQVSPDLAIAVIRAMIGAAKADGHVDATESQKIFGRLETAGISSQEKMLLMQEMANTPDVNEIATHVKTPQESAEVYLAALLVCDSQCAREQQYLGALASSLRLDPVFTASLQQELLAMNRQTA
jgi:uncharacterized membrane protein YebE (DUF533 family)